MSKRKGVPVSKKELVKPVVSDERALFSIKVAEVVSARIVNPRTGGESEFYRLNFPDWVNIVAVTKDDEIVFIRQYRFGSGGIELEIPGGAVEQGESPLAAGERELLEETGYAGKNSRIIGYVRPNPAIQGNRCYTLLVEGAEKVSSQDMEDMEDIEVLRRPRGAIEKLIHTGEIRHGLVLNALMFYEKNARKA